MERGRGLTVTICGEKRVNLWSDEGGEDDGLTVELTPLVQSPEPHAREVNTMSLSGL